MKTREERQRAQNIFGESAAEPNLMDDDTEIIIDTARHC